jgi:hypothetical protein
LIATLVALVLALAIIIPSLALLYRLSLQDRLKEGFHPIEGADTEGATP